MDILDENTKTQLFINIVNCLSGKDVILYFKDEKAFIRKDEVFSMWTQCYLTLDSNTLKVKKKINKDAFYEFDVLDLRVSKTYKKYKRKIVMGLVYKKKENYLIGFDHENNCARVYELIRNLIR